MTPFSQLGSLQSLHIEGPGDKFSDNGVISAIEGSLSSILSCVGRKYKQERREISLISTLR